MRTLIRSAVIRAVRALTGRVPVLLPADSADEAGILDLRYRYRVDGTTIAWTLGEAPAGELTLVIRSYKSKPGGQATATIRVAPQDVVTLDMETGTVAASGRTSAAGPSWPFAGTRKLVVALTHTSSGGVRRRTTMHYRADPGRKIDEAYYTGDDYVDYESEQAEAIRQNAEEIVRHAPAGARVLEIGCATGLFLREMTGRGFDARGVDASTWAVARAAEKVGAERARVLDADSGDPVPFDGEFDVLYMNDVIEHFARPWDALERFSAKVRSGGKLFLSTGNAESLTARWFGADWEGFTDYSHVGITEMTAANVRRELDRCGWVIEDWVCDGLWLWNADPVYQCLNDYYFHDARFRRLVIETGAGDIFKIRARRR